MFLPTRTLRQIQKLHLPFGAYWFFGPLSQELIWVCNSLVLLTAPLPKLGSQLWWPRFSDYFFLAVFFLAAFLFAAFFFAGFFLAAFFLAAFFFAGFFLAAFFLAAFFRVTLFFAAFLFVAVFFFVPAIAFLPMHRIEYTPNCVNRNMTCKIMQHIVPNFFHFFSAS